MIELKENELQIDTYQYLRRQVGWKELSERQAELALSNCLFRVCAYEGDKPLGMGRVVGDGAVICYIQDLVVIPDAQGQKVGTLILNRLRSYVESCTQEGTTMMLCLMSAKGREHFYLQNGFTQRPNTDLGPGMIQFIVK